METKHSESYGGSTQLLYLRARYYNPTDGRFISRDTWGGDVNNPLSMNRWNYVEGNPVNRIDPSGLFPCPDGNDPECISKVRQLKTEAKRIKEEVIVGSLLPVEGFAQFLDLTMSKFDNDIGSTMWASTLIINGFDSSAFLPVWAQAYYETNYGDQYFIGEDWLPYKDASCKNIKDYYDNGSSWICSRQGDWKTEYWDNTANQAYHGWFSASTAFFDGVFWANLANVYHEGSDLEPLPAKGPPPISGNTKEDYVLSIKMMQLGYMLSLHYIDSMVYRAPGQCPPNNSTLPKNLQYVSPGSWIRANLKDN